MATPRGPLSCNWSWETTGERNKFSVHFDVGTLLLFDFVTPFGTIREQRRDFTDDEGRPLNDLRSLHLDFDLHHEIHDFLHYTHVGSVIDEALSRLRLDSHPLADELHLIVAHLVLTALSGYLQRYYDADAFGCVVRIRVEEEKVTTVKVLSESAKAYFGGYVRVGTSVDGIMLDGPCAICLGDLSAGDEIGRTECGHCFHFGCIARWLCRRMSCPMCRTAVERLRF